MQFLIADTFTDSLANLTDKEQKAVKTTAFDLQMDPARPGMHVHKLARAKDPCFKSVRVSRDLRIIVHQSGAGLLLCYVGHHDEAYAWAERRKLEIHPKTGAAQLVEIRETVREIQPPEPPAPADYSSPKPFLFSGAKEDTLLSWGVPQEWLDDVREANEDTLLELADHLPAEAAESLLEYATGGAPAVVPAPGKTEDPFEHPDARRRFRVMNNVEELAQALDYPWEKWTVFLHPEQRRLVENQYGGPVRVSGSAGTGKTIVALHRAVFQARRHPDARILLTTFSDTLANALKEKLIRLAGNQPRLLERIEVYDLSTVGLRLYECNFGRPTIAQTEIVRQLILEAAGEPNGDKFDSRFLFSEWDQVVDAWRLETREAYRDVLRLGRKTRLAEKRRKALWEIFETVHREMKRRDLVTLAQVFDELADHFKHTDNRPYDFMVVDEAQDISVCQLKFLANLGKGRPDGLFFAGDLGQRIFQQPFSWKALGMEIRGRSFTLKINYRTSHQIRKQADRLLGPEISDVDGNKENRLGTISEFNGPKPSIVTADGPQEEAQKVGRWLKEKVEQGVLPHEIGVFVRSKAQLDRAVGAVSEANLEHVVLDDRMESNPGKLSVSTMHLAKGLEFRAVVIMACDDEVIPLQSRIETAADQPELEEIYNTERHLRYVACTRARDYLLVTGVDPGSEFIDDLQ